MKEWKVLDSKLAFDHRWFKVQQDTVRLPNGKEIDDFLPQELRGTVFPDVPTIKRIFAQLEMRAEIAAAAVMVAEDQVRSVARHQQSHR